MRAIGLAMVDSNLVEGDEIEIEIRGKQIRAVIVPYLLRNEAPPYCWPIKYEQLREEKKTLHNYFPDLKKEKEVHLLIGPEGGFDPKEVDLATSKKVKRFTLGRRILRTETAAISALSLILLSGDESI